MPYLGDFLGHILAELTISRMQADLESLRIADFYAGHPLLRTLPVPRFRLPQVEFDVPVVIERVEEAEEGAPARGGIAMDRLKVTFEKALAVELEKEGIRLPEDRARRIKKAAEARIDLLRAEPAEVAVDTHRIARDLARVTARELEKPEEREAEEGGPQLRRLEEALGAAIRSELIRTRTPPPRLLVRVATDQLREAGPAERIGHIKLSVSEEHLEWTLIETEEGEKKERLVAE